MENYKKFEIENKNYEYKYDYSLGTINLYNTNIQKENERKFDTLLDSILFDNMNKKKDKT